MHTAELPAGWLNLGSRRPGRNWEDTDTHTSRIARREHQLPNCPDRNCQKMVFDGTVTPRRGTGP